ncbi:FMN-binding glutamate synthase family protein [Yunchengibacter salinarum]|uniref:FMN-binding glutamate synthase family protein n=1 Tax=Yunchengibacter salinarum TaxID=3133399 RepID=UPI0035B5A2A4
MDMLPGYVINTLQFMAVLFVFVVGTALAFLVLVFIRDKLQTKDAILNNYPVVGHLRYIFTTLGEFFRQYFFAMDREEMPFNRAERNWVYGAAKDSDNTMSFGSTKLINEPGTPIFMPCPFPTMEKDAARTSPLRIGPFARKPFDAPSLFNVSGMSYGALSVPAVRALSLGSARAGCWMNTGEGGLSAHHLEGGGDVVFQIGTAKYGVRTADGALDDDKLRQVAAHDSVRMFELKLSQGAKPGKGGILPADKVGPDIARIRGIPVGEDSISPNRHPEVNAIADLLDVIGHIRGVTGKPTGFKAVMGDTGWITALCLEIEKRGPESAPDFITIDSADGGTGAAPMPLMDNVGLPIRESLPTVAGILRAFGLKERIRLIASGKLIVPGQVAWALSAGADFVVSARGFMFALGCIQAMRCNKNTCPTGVTTHNKRLQRALNPMDKADRVANYCRNITHEVETIAHSCGVPEPRQLKRKHVRIVKGVGASVPLDDLYPDPDPAEARAAVEKLAVTPMKAPVPGQH